MDHENELLVVLTGELVTLTGGGAHHVVPLSPGTTVTDVLETLARSLHPGFGAMALAGGVFPGLGGINVLLDGHPVDLRTDLERPVAAGTMYLIPPILGG